MCEAININFKSTGTESPWSNSLVEGQNLILGDMLDRILEESVNNIDIAAVWAINTKKSLKNVHGFSPLQWAIVQNPPHLNLCCHKETTSFTHTSIRGIPEENLCYLHKAR